VRIGGKIRRIKANGIFSAEEVQPAELKEKPAVATCSLGTMSISA